MNIRRCERIRPSSTVQPLLAWFDNNGFIGVGTLTANTAICLL
jgi:hypothetical protein